MRIIICRSPRVLFVTCLALLIPSSVAKGQNSVATALESVAKLQSAVTQKGSASAPEPAQNQQLASEEQSQVAARAADSGEFGDPSMPKPDLGAKASASQGSSTDKWVFRFVPYLWFASLKGQVGIGDRIVDVDMDFGDIFDELNFGFMAEFEARKNKFSLVTDLLYLKVSTENATPGTLFSSLRVTQKVLLLEQDAGFQLIGKNGSSLDAFAGIRFWHLNTRLLFTPGISPELEVDGSRNWVDGIAGLRGRAKVSKHIFVFGRGDAGGGGSDLTYQLTGGAGLSFHERFSFLIAYRYLNVDYDRDRFLFDFAIKGPAIGFGIRF